MIPAKFDYVRPLSLASAVEALAGGGEDGKVIAGGQSLLPLLRLRLAYPSLLVDVGDLDSLAGVSDAGDALVIGALTMAKKGMARTLHKLSSKKASQIVTRDQRQSAPFVSPFRPVE